MTLQCFFIFLLSFCCLSTGICAPKPNRGVDFDYLLLAQFWPTSSAIYFENEHKHWAIPQGVDGWTIHGLWPSIPGTEKPDYCNNSMTFDFSQIEVLSKVLATNWPDYCTDEDKTALWNHEWTKHGTCAYSMPVLKGELRYFNETLSLHSKLNTASTLGNSGVIPSKIQQYSIDEIFYALKKGYGKIPNFTCVHDEENDMFHLEQIWLCFNKQLEMIDCPDVTYPRKTSTLYFESMKKQDLAISARESFEGCPHKGKISYYPIPRE
ncbi:helix-loop-helix protein delilah-like [Plakobranchus ocellatus]|uniref:Helix-loop-helix protein delilah-like n=1 Tax=Plakobranchus ocellatus TaxID=259542 RepID=A0AAV3YJ07_9GAST|nr:helix-loop-helix protein delilah-like [Plakobranchus ocellatus]